MRTGATGIPLETLDLSLKVRSHGAAAAAIFWPQQMGCIGFNLIVHTAAAVATVPQVNGFGTHFVRLWQWHHEGSPDSGILKPVMVSVGSSIPTGGNYNLLRHLDANFVQK